MLHWYIASWDICQLSLAQEDKKKWRYPFQEGCLGFAINLTKTTEVIGY